eukprot:Gb_10080 [translate_table: standard]
MAVCKESGSRALCTGVQMGIAGFTIFEGDSGEHGMELEETLDENGEILMDSDDERMDIEMQMARETHFHDIPEVIISNIFSAIKDTRSRNRMALVCRKWREMERSTRLSFCIRGNICNLYLIPKCFQSVTNLDLSLCSPWGYPPLDPTPPGQIIGHLLKQAFPMVNNITIYVRNARNIDMLVRLWPGLEYVKLVRWHQRALDPEDAMGLGMELLFLMQNCRMLKSLDLSEFYCWTEDIPPALQAEPHVSANLRSLNLLKLSTEGFKAQELIVISSACRNIEELYAICVFDPRYMDVVGDDALATLAKNCVKIRILHLVDATAFGALRGNPEEGFSSEEARITRQGLEEMFRSLPLLEDFVLDISQNVRDSGPVLELLGSQCKKIRSLKLGQFHGICKGPQPDGVALCSNLEELCIKNCADLCDMGLATIATGCRRLVKLELQGCKEITETGLNFCVSKLKKTLIDVRVSCCKYLDAAATVRALEPVRECIRKLHIDCVWHKSILEQEIATPSSAQRSNSIGPCTSFRREMISYGVAKDRLVPIGSYNEKRWEETQNCAGEPFLELRPPRFFPDLNHSDYGCDASSSNLPITSFGLDLNLSASSYTEHSEMHSYISGEEGCLPWTRSSGGHKDTNTVGGSQGFERYASSDEMKCGSMDIKSKALQIEQNTSFDSDFVSDSSSVGFMDFLGVNEKHQGVRCEAGGNDCLEVMGKQSQVWGAAGESSKRTSLANSEGETLYKKKCIYNLRDSKHHGKISERNRLGDPLGHFFAKTWNNLNYLSLWIPVGELLTPLAAVGLKSCPVLEEIKIRVEGDCRHCPKPKGFACGLNSLVHYPSLSKLQLDCGEAVGYALSAPGGHMDLSLWERWYLKGVEELHLSELDYWPPQDKDMNRRGLSLPAAGLLSECATLRKLFIHGTAHEHFMMMLIRRQNLRDVQLREDYYPAPEDDTSTEMRTDSCKRFEEALAKCGFAD